MNYAPLVIFLIVFLLILGVVIWIALFDWRTWIMKRWGPNYKHGLAHIKLGNIWVYRPSEIFYEGPNAMTYTRALDYPDSTGKTTASDILPESIGFDYHEGTGRRVYRMQPGGTVATSDNTDHPMTDYPSEMLSAFTLGRTATKYIQTVSGKKQSSAGMWALIIILVLVLIIGGIFLTNRKPAPAPVSAPAVNSTTNTTPPSSSTITYQFEGK